MVRPKKYKKGETTNPCTFYNHPRFRKTWEHLTELAEADKENPIFLEFVSGVEGERQERYKKQGNRACYVRWILSKHLMENIHKIKSDKKEKDA